MIFSPAPDGYLINGLTAFNGPANGGAIAQGYQLELPEQLHAGAAELNLFNDTGSGLLRLLPEDCSLMAQFRKDSDFRPVLLPYQELTGHTTNPRTQLLRNANFICWWRQMEQRQLFRQQVDLYVGRPVAGLVRAPWQRRPAENHYTHLFDQWRTEFDEWERTLSRLLAPLGGTAVAMKDADHFRRWAHAFNPSYADRPDYDPLSGWDPQHSLLQNCWLSELSGLPSGGFLLDSHHFAALMIKRPPRETFPGQNQVLLNLPFTDYTLTMHVRRLPKEKVLTQAQRNVERLDRQLAQRADERLAVMRAQETEKMRRLATGEGVALHTEFIILIWAKTADELTARKIAVQSAVQSMDGAQYYEATLSASARNLFWMTLPGWMWGRQRGFTQYAEDRSAADQLPLGASFQGHRRSRESIYSGSNGNLVTITTILGEGEDATVQQGVVLGTNGIGKSLWLGDHLQQSQPLYLCTAIVEEGLAQVAYSRSFGVEPIVFSLDGQQTLNLLDTAGLLLTSFQRASVTATVARMAGRPADEDKARRQQALIAQNVSFLYEAHAQEQLRTWPEEKCDEVKRHALALDRWAKDKKLTTLEAFVQFRDWQQAQPEKAAAHLRQFPEAEVQEFESLNRTAVQDLVFASLAPGEHLTLSSLREHFAVEGETDEECRWLGTLLQPWCRGGQCGVLFDGASNVSLSGPVIHFELGLIPESVKEIKAVAGFLTINHLRHHLLSLPRLAFKRILIEEISRFFDVPGSDVILRELLEQFRKHRVQVTISAQSYSRIADTPLRVAICGNVRWYAVFNTGDRRDVERLCADVGLSRVAQEAILRFARPDQMTGPKYSEFLYYHTGAPPVCGTVRFIRLLDANGAPLTSTPH